MKENSTPSTKKKKWFKVTDQDGQSLIEFIFLMASMIIISFALLRSFNSGIGQMWKTYVNVIAQPTTSPIELR